MGFLLRMVIAASVISLSDGSRVLLRNGSYFMSMGSKRPGNGDTVGTASAPYSVPVAATSWHGGHVLPIKYFTLGSPTAFISSVLFQT